MLQSLRSFSLCLCLSRYILVFLMPQSLLSISFLLYHSTYVRFLFSFSFPYAPAFTFSKISYATSFKSSFNSLKHQLLQPLSFSKPLSPLLFFLCHSLDSLFRYSVFTVSFVSLCISIYVLSHLLYPQPLCSLLLLKICVILYVLFRFSYMTAFAYSFISFMTQQLYSLSFLLCHSNYILIHFFYVTVFTFSYVSLMPQPLHFLSFFFFFFVLLLLFFCCFFFMLQPIHIFFSFV